MSRDGTDIEAKPAETTALQNNLELPQNNAIRKKPRPPAMSVGPKPTMDDWPCPDPSCGNVNFAKNKEKTNRITAAGTGIRTTTHTHRWTVWQQLAETRPASDLEDIIVGGRPQQADGTGGTPSYGEK